MNKLPEDATLQDGAREVVPSGSTATIASPDRLFQGGGEMGRILASIRWADSSLGPVETWPQTLRTSLRICLTSRHDIIIWWGRELHVFYNDAYAPTLGVRHPDAAGKPGREVWPEIWDVIGPMLEGVLRTGQPTWSYDQLLYLERNGYVEETYHTYSYSPIEDDSGEVGGVFTAVTETTLRVLAERRAVVARDLAAAVVDARTAEEVCTRAMSALGAAPMDVPFAWLYLVDRGGHQAHLAATAGSPAYYAAVAPAEVDLSAPLPELARGHIVTSPWQVLALAQVARTGRRDVFSDLPIGTDAGADVLISAAPGRAMPTQAVALPIIEPGQSTPSALLLAGVNPHRSLDDDYLHFYDLLATHLASALAAAHAYEEERQRAEALAAIDRAKTTFFSNVSHEFRTPLTLMLGPLADSLADSDEPLSAPQYDRVSVALRNGTRLLKLVNTLLDFSRIEAGRIQANYEPTDASAYTAELASAFRSLVEKAGLALVVDCPPLTDLPAPVYVDREMWEKIVLNLLSNAFKYTFSGAITVALRATESGQSILLEVRDTGVGIPQEELPRLFERFHRVEGARARTHEGSGIGLALVQELVHLHSGEIWVDSQEGVGTSVFVRLPTGLTHLPGERVQTRSALTSTALGVSPFVQEAERWLPDEPTEFSSAETFGPQDADAIFPSETSERVARVVLADDNADMRGYLRRLLAERYDVEAVSNGRAALEAIRRQRPDLVLSDVMMPELDGFGLLEALRADPRTRAIPVILLSARAGTEATTEGLRAGADDYLIKPFSAREVMSRVAARLEMARLRNEAEARGQEFERIFEAIADAAFVYDRDGHIVRMNPAAHAMLGLDKLDGYDELSPQRRAELTLSSDARGRPIAADESGLSRLLRGEALTGSSALDVRLNLADGRLLEVNITGAPLVDASGAITGAVAISRDVTEQRRVERASAERASTLEGIFEAMTDGVVVYGPNGEINLMNHAYRRLLALDDDMLRMPIDDRGNAIALRHPVTRQPLPRDEWPSSRILRGETLTSAQSLDVLVRALDGREVLINCAGAPVRDQRGHIEGGVMVIRDVAERRRLEQAARESEARLRSVLELLPVGVALVDTAGRPEIVNQALKGIWGKDMPLAQSLEKYGEYRAWWPETGKRVRADEWGVARALMTGDVSLAREIDIMSFDGANKTILASDAPLRDESGVIVGAMSVLVDITERKRLEERTREALNALLALAAMIVSGPDESGSHVEGGESPMLRGLERALPGFAALCCRVLDCRRIAIIAIDPDTSYLRTIAVNGSSPDEERRFRSGLVGLRLADRFGGEVLARLAAGETTLVNVERFGPEDPARILSRRFFLLAPMVAGGALYGYIGVNFGDEERHYTQENSALAQVVARLIGTVMEREQLLRERTDAETRELALQEATRRMDEFIGIASHELRTPLTSITANVELAGRQLASLRGAVTSGDIDRSHDLGNRLERSETLLERTRRQVVRMDRLVGDLLDVSRIQAGKLELRYEDCDLLPIVREAVREQRAAWPNRSITLDLTRRGEVPIHADADRIGQVITNYLTNALKYSPADGPVEVRARLVGKVARVGVRDQGPGLTPEQQERLFERFYRVPGIEQQSGSGVGLGLGLHICKTIVERHGGQVGVESAPGVGSTFWFTIPMS